MSDPATAGTQSDDVDDEDDGEEVTDEAFRSAAYEQAMEKYRANTERLEKYNGSLTAVAAFVNAMDGGTYADAMRAAIEAGETIVAQIAAIVENDGGPPVSTCEEE